MSGRVAPFGSLQDRRVPVTNYKGEECGEVVLPGSVFDLPLRKDIVHSVVRWQLAKRRQGTHSTKGVGEVRGSSRKPWQQKGSGRARHGSLRGPQFRGGATMHGPKPCSHEHSLPKKVRRLGLRIALSSRLAEGKLVVYQQLEPENHRTKEIAAALKVAFPHSKKILLVDQRGSTLHWRRAPAAEGVGVEEDREAEVTTGTGDGNQQPGDGDLKSSNLVRATSNLHYASVLPALGLNVYSILQHDTLVMSLAAVQYTVDRLQPQFLSRRERQLVALQAGKERRPAAARA